MLRRDKTATDERHHEAPENLLDMLTPPSNFSEDRASGGVVNRRPSFAFAMEGCDVGIYFKLISGARVAVGQTIIQPIDQSIDVEGFDVIEASVFVQYDGANAPDIYFASAFQKNVDDLASAIAGPFWKGPWAPVATITAATQGRNTVIIKTTPASGVLGKWLRWAIVDNGSTSGTMVDSDAIGRRYYP